MPVQPPRISPAPTRTPPQPAPAPPRTDETPAAKNIELDLRRSAMTTPTNSALPDALMTARLGAGTLASALDAQIRYRVDRGDATTVDDWRLVPDNSLTRWLARSESGERLEQQLTNAMRSTAGHEHHSNLKGFVLPRDADAAAAARMLSVADSERGRKEMQRMVAEAPEDAGQVLVQMRDGVQPSLERATAWNQGGWITLAPQSARALLTAAGAYRPSRIERTKMSPLVIADRVNGTLVHEVQHSISPPDVAYGRNDLKWIEEGTANLLSRTPLIIRESVPATKVTPRTAYAHSYKSAGTKVPWGPYRRPPIPEAERATTSAATTRNYVNSMDVLTELVMMGGGHTELPQGVQRMRDLLQSKPLSEVPDVLATAIAKEHRLRDDARSEIARLIPKAIDDPAVMNRIRALMAGFPV